MTRHGKTRVHGSRGHKYVVTVSLPIGARDRARAVANMVDNMKRLAEKRGVELATVLRWSWLALMRERSARPPEDY